jgi:hypothetical protein
MAKVRLLIPGPAGYHYQYTSAPFSLQFNVNLFAMGIKCVRPCNAAGVAAILIHGVIFEEG